MTAIIFVGSVFSPAYRWARQRARKAGTPMPAAERYAAVNLAIYGQGRRDSRWVFSEYRDGLSRSADGLSIAGSSVEWVGDELVVRIDDFEPWTQRPVRGEIRVAAGRRYAPEIDLAGNGQHRWFPVAPASHATVRFDRPDLSFDGTAYHDVNWGDRPLEDDFIEWDWSRLAPKGAQGHDSGLITYDVRTVHEPAEHQRRAFAFGCEGLRPARTENTELLHGPKGFWGVRRKPVGDAGSVAEHLRSLEDSPFYTRSLISTQVDGRRYDGVHEALRMDRFVKPVVQAMLPFRIRRR